jgi:hypothetical protein
MEGHLGKELPVNIYISHAIRGPAGDQATEEDIYRNYHKASLIANQLRLRVPQHNWYCPHENPHVVHWLWEDKKISSHDIIQAECDRIKKLFHCVYGFGPMSTGMVLEKQAIESVGRPFLWHSGWDDEVWEVLPLELKGVMAHHNIELPKLYMDPPKVGIPLWME